MADLQDLNNSTVSPENGYSSTMTDAVPIASVSGENQLSDAQELNQPNIQEYPSSQDNIWGVPQETALNSGETLQEVQVANQVGENLAEPNTDFADNTEKPAYFTEEQPQLNVLNENQTDNLPNMNNQEVKEQTINSNSETIQAEAMAAKKEKLIQLLKAESDKWKKSWFIKWILSWVGITLWILAISVVLAKEQIVSLLSNDNLNFSNLEANVVGVVDNTENQGGDSSIVGNENIEKEDENITPEDEDTKLPDESIQPDIGASSEIENIENEDEKDNSNEEENKDNIVDNIDSDDGMNNEDIHTEEKYMEQVAHLLSMWYDNETLVEYLKNMIYDVQNSENPDEKTISMLEDTIYSIMASNNDNKNNQEVVSDFESGNLEDEIVSDIEINENEEIQEPLEQKDGYSIKHVATPEEANRVLSPNCSDTFCGADKNSITLCTEFKQKDDLADDAHRIWNAWTCRYKDVSELVYVEFN